MRSLLRPWTVDGFWIMHTRLIPTPRLVFLCAVGALPLTLAVQVPGVVWAVGLFDVVLFLLVLMDFRRAPDPAAVALERHVGPHLAVGERETVTVAARSGVPHASAIQVRDEPPPGFDAPGRLLAFLLAPYGRAGETYPVTPRDRGDFSFSGFTVRAAGPLGLVLRQWRVPYRTDVQVYPNFRLAGRMELLGRRSHLLRTGLHALRRRGEGRTFESLREYVQGDDTRHLDWKATARRGKPMVREYEVERHQNVFVMVDAGRMMTARVEGMTKLDSAVNAALLVAHAAVDHGDRVGLMAFADEVLAYVPPGGGKRQVGRVLEALYRVRPRLVEPDYGVAFRYLAARRLQRALVLVLTDLVDTRASARLLRHVEGLIPRHLPLLAAIADPALDRHAAAVPDQVGAVFRQAVARDLLQDRAEAIRGITARGGLALDVPPHGLNLAVVNRYLEVKRRGLL